MLSSFVDSVLCQDDRLVASSTKSMSYLNSKKCNRRDTSNLCCAARGQDTTMWKHSPVWQRRTVTQQLVIRIDQPASLLCQYSYSSYPRHKVLHCATILRWLLCSCMFRNSQAPKDTCGLTLVQKVLIPKLRMHSIGLICGLVCCSFGSQNIACW
jgi:hypothetical protein